jgi:hypothetical protein
MDSNTVLKLKRRISESEAIVDHVTKNQIMEYQEFLAQWTKLLSAINGIPEIIFSASKLRPRCRQWFGQKIRPVIDSDPLLSYLKASRGVDYHGPHETVIPCQSMVLVSDEKPWRFVGKETYPALNVVTDNHGNIFRPPEEHLGKTLTDTSALSVAKAAISYYASLIDEAVEVWRM